MELGQQFKIDSIEELEQAYEMFKEEWSNDYNLEIEKQSFKKDGLRYIQHTSDGIYLFHKDNYYKTIPSPLVKRSKPKQYADGIDTFERMEKNATFEERIAFAKGNIDKYVWRKKDQDKQDFEKIIKYAQWAIKQYK